MDKTIKIWDNEGICIKTLCDHVRYVNCVALSKDCLLLASGSNDKSVLVWDVNGNLTLDSQIVKLSTVLQGAFENTAANELRLAENVGITFTLVEKLDDIAEAAINSCHFSVNNILVTGSR
ncbi:nuclear distribution protein nudF [Agrilus planipennis]|uniref:Nuclear distribution protein nudF n=1 Tax=Agrilus planipennis TaxID=224129 RepID=A0A1W4XRF9_AGRPL|nr:nuclear distribution protein nudF [Agrilus planipennis]